MKENQNRGSLFATIPGILILLFFAVTANYVHAGIISVFLFFLFLLACCSRLWSRKILDHIQFSILRQEISCYAGETISMEMNLKNNSFFPLTWLDVIVPTGQTPSVRSSDDKEIPYYFFPQEEAALTGFKKRFAWLLWQQEITWSQELLSIKRGVIKIDRVLLQAGDGFGMSATERLYALNYPARLVMFPKRIAVSVQPFLKVLPDSPAGNQGQTEDITILKNSRAYRPGDPVKRINWRLLAGSGKMEINVYETIMPACATFILDPASFLEEVSQADGQGGTYTEYVLRTAVLENTISLITSVISELTACSFPAALIIPAYEGEDAVFRTVSAAEESSLNLCLEALAQFHYQKGETHFPYEEFTQYTHSLGTVYLCVYSEQTTTLRPLEDYLGTGRLHFLAAEKRHESQKASESNCIYEEDIRL